MVEPAGDRVALRLPDKTITLPAVCAPAVHHLRSGTDADAGTTTPSRSSRRISTVASAVSRPGRVPAAEPTLQP
ncbi:hypothetical protein C6A85_71760 [Mycobacterium sp. ITM-2017-0098]|nr:hypothetical protein C6A85_71760 [Mycobacterium sp. ITM-2017-0098]